MPSRGPQRRSPSGCSHTPGEGALSVWKHCRRGCEASTSTTSGTGRSVDTFIDGASNRAITYAADAPADDGSMVAGTAKDGKSMTTLTDVYYSSQTWTRSTEIPAQPASATGAKAPGLCGYAQPGELNGEDPNLLMKGASALLTCPRLEVTRGQQVDGIHAITIGAKGAKGGQMLWINATTYLPIQQVTVNAEDLRPPAGFNSAPSPGMIHQFTYLPPTPTNLSYLVSPIPAGFTKS
ncbi:MAG TPA: hypothetical protein VHZ03_56145 [Trebonia sp.]|nr:hypothetical protein [Trebonia sp.]